MKKLIAIISTSFLSFSFLNAEETRTVIEKDSQTIFGVPYKFGWQAWELDNEQIAEFLVQAHKNNWDKETLVEALEPYDEDNREKAVKFISAFL